MNKDQKTVLKAVNEPLKPSRQKALEAVRTLIAWAGDDPDRVGLRETPERVINAYKEWFAGYHIDPAAELTKVFEDISNYDDMVILRDIDVESHCEHHMAPFIGKAHLAYIPTDKIVGISKLVKVVEGFAKRLQTQETMTSQIVNLIDQTLKPRGTAIMINAEHHCMSRRGVHHPEVSTVTTQFTGEFKTNPTLQERFLRLIQLPV